MEPRVPDLTEHPPDAASSNGDGHTVVDPGDTLFAPPAEAGPAPEVHRRKPKLKKLRLFLVFAGISVLA